MSSPSPSSRLVPGARVGFIGPVELTDDRQSLACTCADLGLTYVPDPTPGLVDVLVSDFPVAGTPTVSRAEFSAWAAAQSAAPFTTTVARSATLPSFPTRPSEVAEVDEEVAEKRENPTQRNLWKGVGGTVAGLVLCVIAALIVDEDNETAVIVVGSVMLALLVAFVVLTILAIIQSVRKFFRSMD
ncbi:hypothetical protein HMPREF1219_01177 [Corynebacterium pyruviciproducens ATCC BAA-1742]|uniref:Uncharacterized protein n=1 Tax=Corynebacterium pyruviciproducens ATCC BAA-1742 TaxID=1125779 RepID=S2ZZ05_9CORY|nr:hypothetical protein [Corynebacterium pyruviciproducens]EPD69309.1 hypothetical protein HMPREF1219_01177 [Corynebacterium pyruviciproducens ATCC BAA-1742]